MNLELAVRVLNRIGAVDPPGCLSSFVDHPSPSSRNRMAIEIGTMIEHRFAFYYWIKCKRRLQRNNPTNALVPESDFTPPDLVSWDWHNDCGADADVVIPELEALNQDDQQAVGLYSWAGLSQLNDGHIRPAVWLNAVSNVYVIQKQIRDYSRSNNTFTDRYGHLHRIYYFRSLTHFSEEFERTRTGGGVIWDIDLDYFTRSRPVPDQRYSPMWPAERIAMTLSLGNPWMPLILQDLKSITIAFEPVYTGGFVNSLELYRTWESTLFSAPLTSSSCRWRISDEHLL